MRDNFRLFAYFVASLIVVAFFAKSLDYFVNRVEPMQTEAQEMVYRDESGALKYSRGSCLLDSDCEFAGCSSEFCASESVASTCELKPDAPSREVYSCGCHEGYCAWTKM